MAGLHSSVIVGVAIQPFYLFEPHTPFYVIVRSEATWQSQLSFFMAKKNQINTDRYAWVQAHDDNGGGESAMKGA
jgi:hypothetical protein